MRSWRHPSEIAAGNHAAGDHSATGPLESHTSAKRSTRRWSLVSFTIGSVTGVALCLAAFGLAAMSSRTTTSNATNAIEPVRDPGSSPASVAPASATTATQPSSTTRSDDEALTIADDLAAAALPGTTLSSGSPVITAPEMDGVVAIFDADDPLNAIASGVVVDGLVLTSAAAVDDGGDVFELDIGGASVRAELVGVDRYTDLAVLVPTIDASAPFAMASVNTIPPSAQNAAGDEVAIVGAETEPESELAMGEVVAFDERLTSTDGHHLIGAVLTTVRRSDGSSGAALVDRDGNTVGVVISSESFHVAAIPVHEALEIGQRLAQRRWPAEAWLGIGGIDSTDGVVIDDVTTDGPAAVAGILVGDIVTEVEGVMVNDMGALVSTLRSLDGVDQITLELVRDGVAMTFTITPGTQP